jgi:hypothetical protein
MTLADVLPSASPARVGTRSEPIAVPYVGDFIFKKPTSLEIIAAARREKELRCGIPQDELDNGRLNLIDLIVGLELGIHQAPDGWTPTTCEETDDLLAVSEAYKTWRATFRPKVAPPEEGAGEGVQPVS